MDYKKGRNNALSAIAEKQNHVQSIVNISVDKIFENELNSSIFNMDKIEELAEGIKSTGFHGAIEVIRKNDGTYEIISGHRRFRALKLNGETEIPCVILDVSDDDEEKKLEILISSNTLNREITPIALARAINMAESKIFSKRKGNTREALAKFFGKSQTQIHRYKSLLKLIPELQEIVEKDEIPHTYFSEIAVKEVEKQHKFLEMLMEHKDSDGNLSVSNATIKEMIACIDGKIIVPTVTEDIEENDINAVDEEDVQDIQPIKTKSDTESIETIEENPVEEVQEDTMENDEITESSDDINEIDDEDEQKKDYKNGILRSIDRYRNAINISSNNKDIENYVKRMLDELEEIVQEMKENN